MNPKATKILIIAAIILIFLLSTFGIYRYFSGTTITKVEQEDVSPTFPQSPGITTEATGGNEVRQKETRQTNATQQKTEEQTSANFKIITRKPISGSYFIEREEPGSKEAKLFLVYSERESGHLYEIAYNENIPKKLSNTTITRVYESYFNNLGDTFLYRRLDDNDRVQNIWAKLEAPTTSTSTEDVVTNNVGKLNQSLLPPAIKEVAVAPKRDKVFYLTAVGKEFVGTVENFGGRASGKKQVFSSPIGEWLIQWPKDNTIFFNTKPSADIPGYLYSTDINRGDLTKILGDINGLTSNINPDLKKLIYSESGNGLMTSYYYDLTNKTRSALSLKTLPEKCVWGGVEKDLLYCAVPSSLAKNNYPDAWYQGIESFNDEIWLINTSTGQTTLLFDKETLEKSGGIDAINLELSPKEDYLSFKNKKDMSLWLVKVK